MYGLQIACMVFFLPFDVTPASSSGHIIILGDYKNLVVAGTLDAPNVIRTIILKEEEKYGNAQTEVTDCIGHCLQEENCKTVVIQDVDEEKHCILSSFSKCDNSEAYVVEEPGYNTYDVRQADPTGSVSTCMKSCFQEYGCDSCGRAYCSGPNCDKCASTCWTTPTHRRPTVWPNFTEPQLISCVGDYQFIYTIAGLYQYWPSLNEDDLVLRLGIRCGEPDEMFWSYFDGFNMTGTTITVGKFLGGQAGNFWNAPFTDRELMDVSESNCSPFWYGLTECEVSHADSYETQAANNVNPIVRKPKWNRCPGVDDCKPSDIQFLITKRTDAIAAAYYGEAAC